MTESSHPTEVAHPIEDFYQHSSKGLGSDALPAPLDIFEHLPLLKRLAEECRRTGRTEVNAPSGGHVTEIGMRWGNGSTTAFLAGMPAQLISWELEPLHLVYQHTLDLARSVAFGAWPDGTPRTRWQPRTGDSLQVTTEPTDMIFFDSLHTAKHLLAEVMRHGNKARKFLAFHDTVTFGMRGEDDKEPGLRAAINRFQKEHFPLWRMVEDRKNCNGLVVLQRETDYEKNPWHSFYTTGEGTPASRPEGV